MNKREILLKINNDRIWFNDTDFIGIGFTDIPYEHISFSARREIYWKVEMNNFDGKTNTLKVNIQDYSYNDLPAFLSQRPKKEIKYLKFEKFNWTFLKPLLSRYQKIKFSNQLINDNDDKIVFKSKKIKETGTIQIDKKEINSNYLNKVVENTAIREPIISNFEEEFTVDFNDSTFMLGYVQFTKHIKRLNKSIDFRIPNDNILQEFNNIKYWFSKKLKIKKFTVKVYFTLVNGDFSEYTAKSTQIDKIDQNLIEGVKVHRTLEIAKSIKPLDIDNSLFTSDDLYSLDNANDLEGNVFKQTEKDILDILIEKSNVRNKKELTYLSGSKQSLNYRIRFTNHPNFGFIFLAEGEMNNHFIWELLNSHATYVWTIEKDIGNVELQYKKIEFIVNTIMNCGRDKYKRTYKTSNQDNDLILNIIYHKNKESHLIDEFPKWKHRLNELIT